jgi:hypothetical protein
VTTWSEGSQKTLDQGKKHVEHGETKLIQPFCKSTISNRDEFCYPHHYLRMDRILL